ncbi:hypothetical protein, partial [Micromonospora harpali]
GREIAAAGLSGIVVGIPFLAFAFSIALLNREDRVGLGALVMAIAFVITGADIWIFNRIVKRRDAKRIAEAQEDPGKRLRLRISRINQAFAEAASLMDELQHDLEAQQAAREMLLAEAQRQQKLLEFNEGQAEKIRQILVGETEEVIRTERRQQWLFFTLGVLISIPIGVAINLLVP